MKKKEIIELAKKTHNDCEKYDFSLLDDDKEYRTHEKIPIKCKIHDYIFTPECRLFVKGSNCNLCANELRKKNNRKEIYKINFINKAKIIHRDRYDYRYVDYINAKTNVKIRCNKCGRIFEQTPNDHLSGKGCSFCKMSKLELEIFDLLKDNDIKFIYQCNNSYFKWLNKLSLDFYLLEYNIGIECQGRQHFEAVSQFGGEEFFKLQQERDIIKNKLCEENGVKLLYYSKLDKEYLYSYIKDKDNLLSEIIKK